MAPDVAPIAAEENITNTCTVLYDSTEKDFAENLAYYLSLLVYCCTDNSAENKLVIVAP